MVVGSYTPFKILKGDKMFIEDRREIQVDLKDLVELVEYTNLRVEKEKNVLKNPSDDNLRDYNYIVEIHDDIRRRLGIFPKLTEEEKAASAIWRARKDDIEWG